MNGICRGCVEEILICIIVVWITTYELNPLEKKRFSPETFCESFCQSAPLWHTAHNGGLATFASCVNCSLEKKEEKTGMIKKWHHGKIQRRHSVNQFATRFFFLKGPRSVWDYLNDTGLTWKALHGLSCKSNLSSAEAPSHPFHPSVNGSYCWYFFFIPRLGVFTSTPTSDPIPY